ncbi:MAG: response regulator, partial [Acidiferrobacterales bacterium]|nr:response regulator [Acidiferrobacterales bacterium]
MHKLMIVDDSKLIRQKIARECDAGLFDVVCSAENGEEAVSLFREFGPDLVTMDLTMPRLDGIDCIKHLVKIDEGIRILVISALND